MARARNDYDGWTRGLGAYSEASTRLYRPDINKPKGRVAFNGEEPPGPVSRGGPPRYKAKGGYAPTDSARGNGGQRTRGK